MSENNGNGFRVLPLQQLQHNGYNPRKRRDPDALVELADSIKAVGLLEPLLVRPLPLDSITRGDRKNKGKPAELYEIVAGSRRRDAAAMAGLDEVPCVVRELTDRQALEAAVIENEIREDVSAMEKAEGYAALVEKHGATPEEIAGKVGKSLSTVRELLRLARQLPPKARKALEVGDLSASVANLIAARPSPAMREKVAQMALSPWRGQERPSFRDVKEFVHRECMIELKQAPFSQKDAALVPSAGPCTSCPKRTGNSREEYPDGRADVCVDPECYRAKVEAHQKRLVEAARAEGKKVLQGKEAKGLFDEYTGRLPWSSPWVDLDSPCYEVPGKSGTWRKLLGKEACAAAVYAYDPKGTLHHLLDKKAAIKALKERHNLARTNGEPSSDSGYDRRRKQEKQKERVEAELRRRVQAAAAERATELIAPIDETPGDPSPLFQALTLGLLNEVWAEVLNKVAKRRGAEGKNGKAGIGGVHRSEVASLVPELSPSGCVGLLAEVVACRSLLHSWAPDTKEMGGFWQALGIDLKAMRKDVERDLTDKARGKKKAPANGAAKTDKPAPEPECHRCHCKGGALVEGDPGDDWLADLDDDLITIRLLPLEIICAAKMGACGPDSWLCAKCYEELKKAAAKDEELAKVAEKTTGKQQGIRNGKAAANGDAPPAGRCRVCDCCEQDCRICVERTGQPCSWTSDKQDLCSACRPLLQESVAVLGLPQKVTDALEAAGLLTTGHLHGLDHLPPGRSWTRPGPSARAKLVKAIGGRGPEQSADQVLDALDRWLKEQLAKPAGGDIVPVDRKTFLVDLLKGKDVSKQGRALEGAGLHQVGDLLDAAAKHPHGETPLQKVYNLLRAVKGVTAAAVYEIGDAIADSGVLQEEPASCP